MKIDLYAGWQILQDVHDTGEVLGLPSSDEIITTVGAQLSEWEPLPELKQLQLLFAEQPYFGRALRYFNIAPWWYKNTFTIDHLSGSRATLHFTNADYYCKVWLNGIYLGEHEGYMNPFSFPVTDALCEGENRLVVKVWSPWDDEVDGDKQAQRTGLVLRRMVKGTYEHSDTFVQRDVNPVGLYGSVSLTLTPDAHIEGRPAITYTLDEDRKNADVKADVLLAATDGRAHTLRLTCTDKLTGEVVGQVQAEAIGDGAQTLALRAEDIHLWTTWDHGTPWLYELRLELLAAERVMDQYNEVTGFRNILLDRNADHTIFVLNGKRLYIRGTSYFPDIYVSAMCRERYRRDLLALKACGFNLVRVHVHVEQELFYELCTEIGMAVIQDSEFNWMHPLDDSFTRRFIDVFLDTVGMLKRHPAILCWICMNEPTLDDPENPCASRTMALHPGPELYRAVREHDPSRPAIKGSFVESDPDSGDSHNYTGSLWSDESHYSDIYGSSEKFNTEYGFDAPPCAESLRKVPSIYRRYDSIAGQVDTIQHYQYALIKYYTEHYRMQKYTPNAGYVHFLFNDLGPNSYYGLFDWWGLPKKGLEAILESNMPVGVFLKYSRDALDGVYVVNDGDSALGRCKVRLVVTQKEGRVLLNQTAEVEVGSDSLAEVTDLNPGGLATQEGIRVALIVQKGDEVIATNHYEDVFHMPAHTGGHPSRMSHEAGIRLYNA